jgi:hypothetical protein
VLPPLLIALALGALVALDAGLRRAGCYEATAPAWPARWREVPPDRRRPSPYREGPPGGWVLIVPAGIPRAVSVLLAPVLGITLMWAIAMVLGLGDFADVVHGKRPLVLVLASIALAVVRTLSGGATLIAACDGNGRHLFLASALALGLDAALARFALPCSDVRADDVRVALAGGAAQAALALAFAFAAWRRRGLVASAYPTLPPGVFPEDRGDEDDDEDEDDASGLG